MWETYVCAQLRHRERREGRAGSLFFWRDRTREVDFVIDVGGRLELLEAKWTERPDDRDCANLRVVREAVGARGVTRAAVVCRAGHSYPLAGDVEAVGLPDLE